MTWPIILSGLGIPFLILAIRTRFGIPRILGIISFIFFVIGGVLGSAFLGFRGVGRQMPLIITTISFLMIPTGLVLGNIAYFLNLSLAYKKNKDDTTVLIRTIRNIWWPLVIYQLIFAIFALIISMEESSRSGGNFGAGPALGLPGIVAGLIFFSQLIKGKGWARIAVGVLGILGIVFGLPSLGLAFRLETAGLIFTLLGAVFSIGWGTMLVLTALVNDRIKAHVKELKTVSAI